MQQRNLRVWAAAVVAVTVVVVGVLLLGPFHRRDADETAAHEARLERRSERRAGDGATTTTTTVSSSESAPTATVPPGVDTGTGTLTRSATGDPTCPAGSACETFDVACPDVAGTQPVSLAAGAAVGPPRGVVVLFSGGKGDTWWADDRPAVEWLDDLRAAGFETVQVRWPDGWLTAVEGAPASPPVTACRSATTVRYVHETRYLPLGLDPGVGRCGFCVSGNSSGASQVAYGLAYYGLDELIDVAVLTSGPPHAALDKGCAHQPGAEAYWYDASTSRDIDASFGYPGADGPCGAHDSAFASRWKAASIAEGGSDYLHPGTRVHVILGGNDRTVAPAHAEDYLDRLLDAGSPLVSSETVANMGHVIERSADGMAALRAALLA